MPRGGIDRFVAIFMYFLSSGDSIRIADVTYLAFDECTIYN